MYYLLQVVTSYFEELIKADISPEQLRNDDTVKAEPGSISTGTLVSKDLFLSFLIHLCNMKQIKSAYEAYLDMYHQVKPDSYNPYDWDIPETELTIWIIEDMFDALNTIAPEGYYFGAHPGDGSDFGFWQIED